MAAAEPGHITEDSMDELLVNHRPSVHEYELQMQKNYDLQVKNTFLEHKVKELDLIVSLLTHKLLSAAPTV